MRYSIIYNNSQLGPMTVNQIMAYDVNENTQVSKDGGPWNYLYTYPELMSALTQKRSMSGPAGQGTVGGDSKKTLCGIMAILFGTLGIQYFLVGKVAGGFITILLSIVTCGLWGIVTLIQGILMLTMTDEQFYNKYVASTSVLPLF